MKTWLFFLLAILMPSILIASVDREHNVPTDLLGASANIESCFFWAKEQSSPGVSPICAPAMVSEDSARATIKNNPVIKKIKNTWYVFVPYQIKSNYESLWFSLSNIISALESLNEGVVDLYLIKTPETAEELSAIKSDTIIQSLYIGQAKKVSSNEVERLTGQKLVFPSSHYNSVYQFVLW